MSVESISDESLIHFYENVRQQIEADQAHKQNFATGPTVRQYADKLRSEMVKRGYSTHRSGRLNVRCESKVKGK
jgi:hypothetical protein